MSGLAAGRRCADAVCLTCSDEATAMRVVELLDGAMARVEAAHALEEVSMDLIDAEVGEIVLVHAGVAIGKLRQTP